MSEDPNTDWSAWSREAVRLMEERNAAWQKRFRLGRQHYRWHLDRATLRFERETDAVEARVCLVGTASEHKGTFLWSWANEAIPETARTGLEAVREFGARHDLSLLTTPEFKGGRAEGLEMLALSGRVLDAEGVFIDRRGDLTMFFALMKFDVVSKGEGPG
jgi:hypothetical protein